MCQALAHLPLLWLSAAAACPLACRQGHVGSQTAHTPLQCMGAWVSSQPPQCMRECHGCAQGCHECCLYKAMPPLCHKPCALMRPMHLNRALRMAVLYPMRPPCIVNPMHPMRPMHLDQARPMAVLRPMRPPCGESERSRLGRRCLSNPAWVHGRMGVHGANGVQPLHGRYAVCQANLPVWPNVPVVCPGAVLLKALYRMCM